MGFRQRVLELTRMIPRGKVTTYKIIAHRLRSKGYRAVGMALKHNPRPIIVPCHRVIRSDGSLGGFSSKKHSKKALLEKEGVRFKGDKIIGLRMRLFYFK